MGIYSQKVIHIFTMDVKNLRKRLDLTQEELAEISGIPRGRIAKWEQGKGRPKSYDADVLSLINKYTERIENTELEIAEDKTIIAHVKYSVFIE